MSASRRDEQQIVRSVGQRCYSASAHGRPRIADRFLHSRTRCMTNEEASRGESGSWHCPLCSGTVLPTIVAGTRSYARCHVCALISLDPAQRLLPLAEVVRYTEHRNLEGDAGYRRFLERLSIPLSRRLTRGQHGLDFGCGPTPVLAAIMTESGYPTVGYDPLFAPREELLAQHYDFVTCSEVVEHLHDPSSVFPLLGHLLEGGGVLGVMTRLHRPEIPFESWWYRRDSTHVCFYTEATIRWIASHHGWTVEMPDPDVALFSVPARDAGQPRIPTTREDSA